MAIIAPSRFRWFGSSLLSFKENINKTNHHKVETLDFIEFIKNIGKKVRLIKIDIEGAGVKSINEMIDSGIYRNIDQKFVETHDDLISDLVDATNELRRRIKKEEITNINLNWD